MGTKFKGTEKEASCLDALISFTRASESVNNRINEHLKKYDISPAQFGILEALHHLGSLKQNQLAQKILKTPGNITLLIDSLEKKLFVTREREQNDRRSYYVTLTQAGRDLITNIFTEHVIRVVDCMGVLSIKELRTLKELCKKVGM